MAEAARNTQGLITGTDMPAQGWVDRLLPAALRPYAKLMRLDRPIGTWLLLWPCWWSLVWALDRAPANGREWLHLAWLYVLFGVGAVVMRGAGCTYNDIVDRDFDAKVERTRTRPIASGQVSVRGGIAFMALQLLVGLAILLQLNWFAVALGAASLLLVFTYPLMKRITYWPQFVLGLAFNWGALLGWAAVTGTLTWAPALLYAGGIAWTLGYDTIYAHQDKEDDILVGVKSTALKLGAQSRRWIAGFYIVAVAFFAAAGIADGLGWPFYAALALGALQLAWQVADGDLDDAADCLVKFKSNRYFGWILVAGLFAELLLRR
jgi:4-hydroxybenzoate polyprenyltransferase